MMSIMMSAATQMMQRYGEGVPAAAAAVAMLISIGDRCSEACPVIICPVVRLSEHDVWFWDEECSLNLVCGFLVHFHLLRSAP